uniref:Predicted protein n=1 Tax=Hordeum vulgare subsp. vulgare TaxID=112509 RepID=F2EJ03_HORVV|nr:predicted protein [Hordeum vulgare subsp. vulgare]
MTPFGCGVYFNGSWPAHGWINSFYKAWLIMASTLKHSFLFESTRKRSSESDNTHQSPAAMTPATVFPDASQSNVCYAY